MLLTHCRPLCPTQHTLPSGVVARLDRLVSTVRRRGRDVKRQEVLAALITLRAPDTAQDWLELLSRPHSLLGTSAAELPAGRESRKLAADNEQVMLRLPSPVTRRLDLLIDLVQERGVRTSRRQIVSALIVHRSPSGVAEALQLIDAYCVTPAFGAAVPGRPILDVLSEDRLPPGRRPMP
jgi:hypothetical protein